jgi:hypothetical protein
MAYPDTVDELTDGVPGDGIAATTPTGSVSYPHDDHHRALGVAVEAIETQIVGAYTTYTPTLTGSTTDPTLGSGSSVSGFYKRLGRWVRGKAVITFGSSGTNAGSGDYGLLLPVEPVNRPHAIGIGYLVDYSDNVRFLVASAAVSPPLWAANTSKAVIVVSNAAGAGFSTGANPVGAAAPWTWAENDQIILKFDYEAAAAS